MPRVVAVSLLCAAVALISLVPQSTVAAEPTIWDVANAMRTCLPIEAIEGDDASLRLMIRDYRYDAGSLMPNDRFLIGNAEGHVHPIHTHITLVFARTWPTLLEGPDGPTILATRQQVVACFESVDLR